MQNQLANLTDMMSKFMSANTESSSGSGTLPGNTVTNPKEDLKGITTQSGVAYQGPTIPTPSKVAKQGTEASINLMPLSVWKGLSLPELTPTCMTLELADRMESKPVGIAKDVKVKVDQSRFDRCAQGPTPSDDLIVSTTSPTLTPFGDSDFLLFEEADAFLGLEDDPDSPELDPSNYDSEGDILSLEAILNSDPSPPLPNHEQSVPSFKEELKACEAKTIKYSIDEPPETLKKKLMEAPILIAPNWDLPFELMCEASDFAIGAVLGQRHEKHFCPIHYASKTLTDAKSNYITTEKEMLAVVFGTLRAIISDRGTHFCNDQFEKGMRKYGVTHRLSTAYHPKTSGQVEVTNRGLKRILERTIGQNRASWLDKLDDALWAFRTAYKTPIGCTPYKLVYGKACHLPIELEHKAYWALKQTNFDMSIAGDHRKIQLNKLNELRDHAYENSLIYKEKTKRIYDFKIKNRVFNVGDQVLLFNSRLNIFSGKLKFHWSGPFTIAKVFPYGTVELSEVNGPNFKVNGHRIKHYFGGDVPKLVVPDLQTFPLDQP
nr:reverse transcriptase domain-containing protein [Tanacetum cinerariifolium]